MEQPKNNFKIVSDKKARMLLPNALTLINVCIGLSSIKFALDEKFELSIIAIIFATLPSSASNIAAKIIAIMDNSNLASKANLIELKPMQTLISVNAFGKIILAFFSDTILKFFLGCSMCYFLASRVSPAIVFCLIFTSGL